MSTRINCRLGIAAVIAVGAALGIAWAIGLFSQRRAPVHANAFGITGNERHLGWFVMGDHIHGIRLIEYATSLLVGVRSSDMSWEEATNLAQTAEAWVLFEDGRWIPATPTSGDRTPANVNGTIFFMLPILAKPANCGLRAVVVQLGGQWRVYPFVARQTGLESEAQIFLDCLNTIPADILLGIERPERAASSKAQRYFQAAAQAFREQLAQAGYEASWQASNGKYLPLKRVSKAAP
jgi:hypothetical protein